MRGSARNTLLALIAGCVVGMVTALGQSEAPPTSASDLSGSFLAKTGDTASGTLSSNVSSGSNALACTVNGERVDLGTGALDYLDSDGTQVRVGGGSGNLQAATLTSSSLVCSGPVSGTTGTFAGAVLAQSVDAGSLIVTGPASVSSTLNVTGQTTLGAVASTSEVCSGPISGTTGTFSAGVSGTTGAFTGAITGPSETLSGAINAPLFDGGTVLAAFVDAGSAIVTGNLAVGGVTTLNGAVAIVGSNVTMSALQSISWGSGLTITNGAGQYTGVQVGAPDLDNHPVGSTLFHTSTSASNSTTTETTLATYTANSFGNIASVAGRGWHITAAGTFAATGNTKTVRPKFGGTDLLGGAFATTQSGGGWRVVCDVLRSTGTSNQTSECDYGASGSAPVWGVIAAPTIATASSFVISLTGQSSAASSDITMTQMRIEYLP